MNIKILIVSVLSCMAMLPLGGEEALPTVSVIPAPESVCLSQGYFVFGSDTRIHCPQEFVTRAEIISDVIKTFTGIAPKVKPVKKPAREGICFTLSDREYMPQGGYRMEVTPAGVNIVSNSVEGLFYGGQTLVQLIPADGRESRIPCVEISDSPRYEWRGYMHDVSRTCFSTDVLKRYIDVMSLFKLNVLHLHLTDDQGWRIEIRKYPKLTEPLSTEFDASCGEPSERSGYYTQEEIKDLVAYAAERNVTIVPEIDVPGHSWATLLAYPELGVNDKAEPHYVFPFLDGWSYWGTQFSPNILDPTNERVYEFLDGVFSEIAELFPSKYIHFGGDEAKHYIWGEQPHVVAYMKEHDMQTTADLQAMFVSKVCDIIRSKGKTPIGWNDILRDSENLTENTAIMSWLGSEAVKQAVTKGMYSVAVPADLLYLDVAQADRNDGTKTDLGYEMINSMERIYGYDPSVGLSEDEAGYVLGVQGNIWTHIARDVKDVNVQLFPRLLAVAEVGWSQPEDKDFIGFEARVKANLPRLDSLRVDYYRPGGYIAGTWNLSGMSDEVLEWDVTSEVYASGRVSAGFYYLGGGSFLEIDGVELLQDGKVISSDCHDGLADTFRATHKKKTYLYDLEVKNYDPSAKYVLRAKVSTELDGPSYGNFTFSLSPYEPFSVTETTSGKQCPASVGVYGLQCEMLDNPLGIDGLPRLSWKISSRENSVMQTGYRILVASSEELLEADTGDIWDSGNVASDASSLVPYGGRPLESREECWWKVKVVTTAGESDWSAPARWTMGLLHDSDWKAEWTGLDRSFAWEAPEAPHTRLAARYFRKEFNAGASVKKATLYISGMGVYKLYVNGVLTGNHELGPAPTDYSKSVFYNTFDVTDRLTEGANAIGVLLGNGRFFTMRVKKEQKGYWLDNVRNFGFPKMLLQLEIEYEDGTKQTVVSDSSWKVTADGPIRANSEFDGEEYDARKEMDGWSEAGFDDSGWLAAERTDAPGGRLRAQMMEPIEVTQVLKPLSVTEIRPGVHIVDMGQNMVGWLKIKVSGGERGDTVRMRFAERLKEDGSLYMDNIRTAEVTDTYVLKGGGIEEWHPVFTYHGFRYAEITGWPGECTADDFEGQVIHDNLKVTGSFETSDSTLNRIYRNAVWGIRGNYRGMPTDCPQRDERQAWLGDRSTGSQGESFIFSIRNLYSKWLDDIEESQRPDGHLSDIAPNYWNSYTNNVTWPATYIIAAEMLYRQYGDMRPIEKHYPSMKKWMDCQMRDNMDGWIIRHDQWGDWCMPPDRPEDVDNPSPDRITDGLLISTAYYHYLSLLMADFADRLGLEADVREFKSRADNVRAAFNKKYFNKENGYYGNNTVTANIVALECGLVPENEMERVFSHVEYKTETEFGGHVSSGLIGIQWFMRALSDYGRPDLALKAAMARDYPSWGYMIENGATTIWELWNGNLGNPAMNSMNHVMLLGDLIIWYYQYLGGIRNDPASAGFKQMIFKPEPLAPLTYVKADYETPYGLASSSWTLAGSRFDWTVIVPPNTSATVHVPARSMECVTVGGLPAKDVSCLEFLRMEDGYAVFKVLSGKYGFSSVIPLPGRNVTLASPDGRNVLTIGIGENVTFSVSKDGRELMPGCSLSMSVGDEEWGTGGDYVIRSSGTVNEHIEFEVPRKCRSADISYNKLELESDDHKIEFRAYDNGVAYRFVSTSDNRSPVRDEKSVFSFSGNWPSYTLMTDNMENWFEFNYTYSPLEDLSSDKFSILPVMVEAGDSYILLSETDLSGYAGMFLKPSGKGFESLFAKYPEKEEIFEGGNRLSAVSRQDYITPVTGERNFPWRIIGIFDSPAEILEDELVYALSDSADADFSWIRPGKALWDWWNDRNIYNVDFESGINNETYRYMIDFAAEHGLEYVLIDDGWSELDDLTAPKPGMDIRMLCEYAREKGVGILLWARWTNVLAQMDEAFSLFHEWGVKGVKIDFMERNDAKVIGFYEEVASTAARYHMLVDFHGADPIEGMRRKYPNLITREGVLGLENSKWGTAVTPEHDVTLPFIRMWAGPMDYTPGSMLNSHLETFYGNGREPMSQGTRSHQVAMYVVYESPLQMVSDSPTKYAENPRSFDFIKRTPTVWDETVGIGGSPGEYAAVARRSGDVWYIGVMNNSEPRSLEIPLDFLGDGSWTMEYHADGPNAGRQAKDFVTGSIEVTGADSLEVDMARGGGYMAIIRKQ